LFHNKNDGISIANATTIFCDKINFSVRNYRKETIAIDFTGNYCAHCIILLSNYYTNSNSFKSFEIASKMRVISINSAYSASAKSKRCTGQGKRIATISSKNTSSSRVYWTHMHVCRAQRINGESTGIFIPRQLKKNLFQEQTTQRCSFYVGIHGVYAVLNTSGFTHRFIR